MGERAASLLLALLFLVAPAVGVPSELMLQDTLKSALVAFAALLAALLYLLDQRERTAPLRWHGVLWLPLALAAFALGSTAWSHTYLAGVEAVRWLLFALLAWLALNTLTRERLPLLAWCVHGGAVVASVWAAWQFWGELALFPQGPQPASTFVNRNFFAEAAVCSLPFGAFLLARARTPGRVVLLATSLGLVMTAILMTGMRAALVALALLLLLALPACAWRCRAWFAGVRPRDAGAALALVAGTVLVLGSVPTSNPAVLELGYGSTPLARGLLRTQAIAATDESVGVRMQMWRATLRAIADRPLAGLGAGAWEAEIPRYQADGAQIETDYYAHNEFLQLVAEYGLVGWAFLLLLAGWLLHAAWRGWNDRGEAAEAEGPVQAVFLCSLLALMVVSCIGFPWRLAVTGALFAVCVGGLAASQARLRPSTQWLARPLPWSPARTRVAVAASMAGLALAVHGTWLAAQAERKLAGAAGLAIALSASGEPAHPRFAEARQEMLQLVRDGIAIHPHYRKLTPLVADELARWGDWENAIRIWESVLASRPNVVVLLTNTARGYDTLGRREQAFDYLERARALQPDAPAVRSLEVLMLARAGQEQRALRRAQEALAAGIVDYDLVRAAFLLAMRANDAALAGRALEHATPAQRAQILRQAPAPYRAQFAP